MTPRERVLAALRGEMPNKVPLTAYADQVPRSEAARRLRNGGLCLIDRRARVHRTVTPHTACRQIHYQETGRDLIRTVFQTTAGEISKVEELGPRGARWHVERLFKSPADYAPLQALAADQEHREDYAQFAQRQVEVGGDVLLKPEIGYSPLHEIMYAWMGIEAFAVEWAERQDEVLALYEAVAASRRRLYPVIANSPAEYVTYCGNISPEVVGLSRFQTHYLPHLDEFAGIMHEHGKLTGTQFDAGTWLLEEVIGVAALDCVEHFTPVPDGDMTVAQARTVWHDKALWVNVPPSVLQGPTGQLQDAVQQILREGASGVRLLLGVTDNLPAQDWQSCLLAIMRVVNAAGELPLR